MEARRGEVWCAGLSMYLWLSSFFLPTYYTYNIKLIYAKTVVRVAVEVRQAM